MFVCSRYSLNCDEGAKLMFHKLHRITRSSLTAHYLNSSWRQQYCGRPFTGFFVVFCQFKNQNLIGLWIDASILQRLISDVQRFHKHWRDYQTAHAAESLYAGLHRWRQAQNMSTVFCIRVLGTHTHTPMCTQGVHIRSVNSAWSIVGDRQDSFFACYPFRLHTASHSRRTSAEDLQRRQHVVAT